MTLPLCMCPWVSVQFFKPGDDAESSVPNSGGFVFTYIAGTTTDRLTYTNAQAPLVAHSNPIELDDQGRPPSSQIFLLAGGYTFEEQDSDGNVLRTYDYVADVAYTFMTELGTIQSEGTTATTSPYVVLSTDNTVQVDSATTPFIVQLPPAADRTFPLIIKNLSAAAVVRVTPDGAETIDTVASYSTIPVAVSPYMPAITLLSDGVSNWVIQNPIAP